MQTNSNSLLSKQSQAPAKHGHWWS